MTAPDVDIDSAYEYDEYEFVAIPMCETEMQQMRIQSDQWMNIQ